MNCLRCDQEFESKRPTAKFCSAKCRVAYNRAHPKTNGQVTKLQLQILYNEILALVQKNQPNTPVPLNPVKNVPIVTTMPIQQQSYVNPQVLMMKYVDERRELTCEEQFKDWLTRLAEDTRLTSKQKEVVKNTH